VGDAMIKFISDLYEYRELLKNNIKKEIRGKYKGAWLGILWSFLNPLFMLVIYSIVFSQIMKVNIPNYSMFMFVALIPWTFFTTTVANGTSSIIANGGIIKKVYFPREIIPVSVVTSNTVNFLISSIITFAFLLLSGVGITKYALLFPIILLIQYILTLGIIFILSSVTVFVRDIEHFVQIILMALFYGTPIVYSMSMVPAKLAWILNLNPMTPIVSAYRDILFYQKMPDFNTLLIECLIIILIFFVGLFSFRKLQRNFVEEL
jgi:ABC-type polysaccharide/polyol phosphate export permease